MESLLLILLSCYQEPVELAKLNLRTSGFLKASMRRTRTKIDLRKIFSMKDRCIQRRLFMKMISNLHRALKRSTNLKYDLVRSQLIIMNQKNRMLRRKLEKMKMVE